jgi:RimJ/RimL family protein N-acetyltransferase
MSVLTLRDSGAVAGFCGLVHPAGQSDVEIKYALRPEYWGAGFATEAVEGMLAYGHDCFGMARIIATVASQNLASRRVLTKAALHQRESRIDPDGSLTCVFEWRAPQRGDPGA